MQKILIIGATSAIAKAVARIYAQRGAALFLVARDEDALLKQAKDLEIRGAAQVFTYTLDVLDVAVHKDLLKQIKAQLGHMDLALLAYGVLPDQQRCAQDMAALAVALQTNAISVVYLLQQLALQFIRQKEGTLAVITSVAADRGRQSNYIYGAAKAMVSVYLQGLRNYLYPHHVHVLEIKPGYVDTPMTMQFKKNALWSQPEQIACGIVKAVHKKRNIVYLPGFWCWVMGLIKMLPEGLFKRLRL